MSQYTPPTEGDPGRLAYLHNANWTAKPHVQSSNVDPRLCPGCLFPEAMRKHEHVNDERCRIWKTNQVAALIEAGIESGGKAPAMPRCGGNCGDSECAEAARLARAAERVADTLFGKEGR